MTTHQLIATKPVMTASQSFTPARGSLLQRKCACGGTPGPSGECAECEKQKRNLQRKVNDQSVPGARLSPLHVPGLQRKLTIGASNDPLEQEADRVADQVLASPSLPVVSSVLPQIQRFSGQPTEHLETASANVDRVITSPGRPLDPVLMQDMSQRFGHDFSRVRVHSDVAAGQSARDVNALAYTVGRDLVFGVGQFDPATPGGRRLLAHELTHVVQQSGADRIRVGQGHGKCGLSPFATEPVNFGYGAGEEERPYETRLTSRMPNIGRVPTARLQRTATWSAGTERTTWDAADRTMNAASFGFTPPLLNGSTILSSAAAVAAIQAPAWAGRSVSATGTGAPGSEVYFVANATNTASYQLDSLDAGPHNVAATKAAVAARITALGMTPPAQCTGPGASTFSINGQPNNTDHSAAILAHERRHATDHQTEFGNVIQVWDTAVDASIAARTVYSGPDPATAEANMWAAVGGTPSQIATNQHNAWITANNNYHGSPAGTAKRPYNPQANATCATSSMDHIP